MDNWRLEPAHDHNMPLAQSLRCLHRENGLIATAAHLASAFVTCSYLILFHQLRIVGRRHLPRQAPFVLVANHASHLDALILATAVWWRLRDRCFPIAAGDTFFETPVLTAFAAGFMNALPMWRDHAGRHALSDLRRRLVEEPCIYILFPEGTRARDGKLAPFKLGLGLIVAGQNVPVVPCHIQGAFEAVPPNRRWPKPGRITLRIGRPLTFQHASDDREGWTQITRETEAAVRKLAVS